jgi:hypothetical protein
MDNFLTISGTVGSRPVAQLRHSPHCSASAKRFFHEDRQEDRHEVVLQGQRFRRRGRVGGFAGLSSEAKCYFSTRLSPAIVFEARKLQTVSLALMASLVLPISFSDMYCSPPGQVLPPPFTLSSTTCALFWQPL